MESMLKKMYKSTMSNSSSSISHSSKQLINPKSSKLVNIIHSELIKPSYSSSVSTKHIGIQCSSNDFTCPLNNSDLILIGHLSNEIIEKKSLPIRIGFNECGIQVDLHENNLNSLIQTYSNRLSIDMIEQFYEICHFDSSWTCLQIDEYLLTNVHHSQQQLKIIPTLRQLTLEKLNQWNEQIKSTDPSFDTHSMDDLLQDINDEDIFENIHSNQIHIPWSIVNSVEEIYGELPNKSILISNDQGLLLPCDDQLTVNIYHALQRFLMKTNQTTKPVRKINQNQKWKSPIENQSNSSQISKIIPSFRQIMDEEEQQAVLSQKSKQKQQLDYVTEHKFKELQRQFSSLDRDLLFDIFRENEYDYDLTFVCLSTMFDENISLPIRPKSVSSNSPSICNSNPVEPVVDSYENLRCNALRHAQKRKEFYIKAQQANHHGMFGVASYYIHCASEQTQLMKNANRTACERLSRWRLKEFYQTQKLDLHGLHADEALNLFKQIEQEYNEKNRRTTPKTIEIITGYGKNSIYGGGYGKIRSVISTYLQQRNYKYSEANKGVLLLQF